ncbi:MAG TPA: L-threonine 3-dehydrogenase [bacterium]|nr:L-threonine 3-dehydrogenase [bacterium]HPS29320.1 L-threonine 3-dehydrogenase [bacterium]
MKKILVIGAAGQIGSELVPGLRNIYGEDNVVAADLKERSELGETLNKGLYEKADILDSEKIVEIIKKHKIDSIYNLVALLSSVGEQKPQLSWKINLGGLVNLLEISREMKLALFTPSSIGAFGPSTPKVNTPQDTIQRPTSMYGVTKVAGELLCDYYFKKYAVDTRGVRFPGIISNVTLPGGGTTDYAVDIYYEAIKHAKYTCYIKQGTFMDMMYMPDCLKAAVDIMEADPSKLKHRNCFNVAAMSFDPEMLAAEIKKHIPSFKMDYKVDPVRQGIADSWPDSMDDSAAREEWGWKPDYNLVNMTEDMIKVLKEKLK